MLYLLDFRVEYPEDMSQMQFLTIWAREADAELGAKQAGVVLDHWKCVGMRRAICIVDVPDPDTLDQLLLDLPIMQELGQRVHVEVTALRRFEDFVVDIKKRLDQ
jgi:muconolactone delta-isomerase